MLNILFYFADIILLLNLIIYLKNYKKFSLAFKIFCYYLILTFTIEFITSFYFESGENNLYLNHYYFIGQFIILSFFFKEILKKTILKNIIFIILISVLLILGLYYSIYPAKYYQFNILEIIITSLPLMAYGFMFLIEQIDSTNKKYIYIVSGFFLYILCSTLLFTTGNVKADIKKMIWYSNAVLYIVYQILIFVEWYKHFRKKELLVKKIV